MYVHHIFFFLRHKPQQQPVGIQRISETESLTYTVGLSFGMEPANDVTINIVAISSKPNGPLNCTIMPSSVIILAGSNNQTSVTLTTQGNVIDEGRGR